MGGRDPFALIMHVVNRRCLYFPVLEEVRPEDRKLSKTVDVDQVVVILFVEPEIGLADRVGLDVPDEIVVHAAAVVFEA